MEDKPGPRRFSFSLCPPGTFFLFALDALFRNEKGVLFFFFSPSTPASVAPFLFVSFRLCPELAGYIFLAIRGTLSLLCCFYTALLSWFLRRWFAPSFPPADPRLLRSVYSVPVPGRTALLWSFMMTFPFRPKF